MTSWLPENHQKDSGILSILPTKMVDYSNKNGGIRYQQWWITPRIMGLVENYP